MFLAGIEVPVPRRFHCAGHIKNVGLHFYLHLAVLGYLGSQIKQYSPRSNVSVRFIHNYRLKCPKFQDV